MSYPYFIDKIDFSEPEVHCIMLGDAGRTDAYRDAIRRTVSPGDRVLDAGAGIGLFGLESITAGAESVTMVERHGKILGLNKLLCSLRAPGADVRFVEADLREVELPPQDVVVLELFGSRLFDEGVAGVLRAFSKSNDWCLSEAVKFVPSEISLWIQPVEVDREEGSQDWMPLVAGSGEKGGGSKEVDNDPAIRWIADSESFRPSGEWHCLNKFSVAAFRAWPDTLQRTVKVNKAANGFLWGFVLQLGDDLLIDNRFPSENPYSWGGVVEQVDGRKIEPGEYTVEISLPVGVSSRSMIKSVKKRDG